MIETQIVKEGERPVAVVLDYKEYMRLKEIEEDKLDYFSAVETKMNTKEWISHDNLKKELNL